MTLSCTRDLPLIPASPAPHPPLTPLICLAQRRVKRQARVGSAYSWEPQLYPQSCVEAEMCPPKISSPAYITPTGSKTHRHSGFHLGISTLQQMKDPPWVCPAHPSLPGPTWLVEVWSQLLGQCTGNVGLLVGSQGSLFCCLGLGFGMACPKETI